MRRVRWTGWFLILASVAAGQQFESARLSPTLYFPSEAAELSSRQALHDRIGPLVKEVAGCGDAALVQELDKAWEAIGALQRHAAYLRIKTLEDTQDQTAKSAGDGVIAEQGVLSAAIDERLRRVEPAQIARLGAYSLLAARVRKDAAHAVSAEAELYRASVTSPHLDAIAGAYHQLIDGIDNNRGIGTQDAAQRRAAITRRDEAFDAAAPAAAALLGTLVDLENRDAVAGGYANAAERKYDSLGLSAAAIDQTLAAVAAEASAYREYQQVLAAHAAKKLGVETVLSAELSLVAGRRPVVSLQDGKELILSALQPLGQDYVERFGKLLDPANGRLDLSGGNHRARTGTSLAVYDAPVSLYYSGYDGSLSGLSKIAHEGGHAIHRELMNTSGIPIYERNGPHYLFEGFAIFNELLLLDRAERIAQTPAERAYALEQLLAKISLELYVSAEETRLERSLYTAASGHAMLDRARIDEIYRESIAPFESFPMSDVGVSRGSMRKPLLWEDPLYLVNYLYAALVAVALYDKEQTDPEFAGHYASLLRRGFDAEPGVLLGSIGIRLEDPKLAQAAARLFREKTGELGKLYASESGRQ